MKKEYLIIIITIIFLTIGALAYAMHYDYIKMISMNSQIHGTIISFDSETNKNSNTENYRNIQYEFTINNQKYVGTDYEYNTFHHIGESVIINYDPQNPSNNCMIVREKTFSSLAVFLFSWFFVGSAFTFVEQKTSKQKFKNIEEELKTEISFISTIQKILLILLNMIILFVIYSIVIKRALLSRMLCMASYFVILLPVFIIEEKRLKLLNSIIKNSELNKMLSKCYKRIQCQFSEILFTDDCIIDYGKEVKIIKYSDILSIRSGAAFDNTESGMYNIILMTKNDKEVKIAKGRFSNINYQSKVLKELKKRVPSSVEINNQDKLNSDTSENKNDNKSKNNKFWGYLGTAFFAILSISILIALYIEFFSIPRSNRIYTTAKVEKTIVERRGGSRHRTSFDYIISYDIGENEINTTKIWGSLFTSRISQGSDVNIYYDKYNPNNVRIITNRSYFLIGLYSTFSLGFISLMIYYFIEKNKKKKQLM